MERKKTKKKKMSRGSVSCLANSRDRIHVFLESEKKEDKGQKYR